MRRSIFFSFACIDLKFCKEPPDHCRIINHGLDLNYKVHNCACADLSFSALHISTWNFLHSFLFIPATISQAWVCSFHTKICGNWTSTLFIYLFIYSFFWAGGGGGVCYHDSSWKAQPIQTKVFTYDFWLEKLGQVRKWTLQVTCIPPNRGFCPPQK